MRSMHTRRAQLAAAAIALLVMATFLPRAGFAAQGKPGELPPAEISVDEGGPLRISGKGDYTSLTLPPQYQRPVIALIDRGGYYVGRDSAFLATPHALTLARIAGDFARPPFGYSIELPRNPRGSLWDLGEAEETAGQGVQVYEVVLFADLSSQPGAGVLDPVEQANGGALSSVQRYLPVTADATAEPYAGTLLVYGNGAGQAFPSGFGADGLLFTEDDPLVALPTGWTVVTLGENEFVFSRGREETVPLYEPSSLANVSLADQDMETAFRNLINLLEERYAFTELRKIDWNAWEEELLPAVQAASKANDLLAFYRVLHDLVVRMKDVHMQLSLPYMLQPAYAEDTLSLPSGLEAAPILRDGLVVMRDRIVLTSDGQVLVLDVAEGSPAAEAGLLPGAEILAVNGMPAAAYVQQVAEEFGEGTFVKNVTEALQFRLQPDTELELQFRNPDEDEQTVKLLARADEVAASSAAPQPLAEVVGKQVEGPAGTAYGYLAFTDLLDVELKATLFQHYIEQFTAAKLPGLVIDVRHNSVGSTQLMEQLLSYFFTQAEPFIPSDYVQRAYDPVAGRWAETGPFDIPPQLPIYAPAEHLSYPGEVVILTGPRCQGACEFLAAWMKRSGRATVLGTERTSGGGGAIAYVDLPGGGRLQYTYTAELLKSGAPYVEGLGVQPDVKIPIDADYVEALMDGRDPDLDFALQYLDSQVGTVQYEYKGAAAAAAERRTYTCADDVTLSVTRLPNLALVVFAGHARMLTRQEAASGMVYADRTWEWSEDEESGSLTAAETGAKLAADCVPAASPEEATADAASAGEALAKAEVEPSAILTGTVVYRERIALPPQAVIEVRLQEVSRADAPATVLAEQRQTADGRQVPIPFELRYNPSEIVPGNILTLQARITVDGQLRWINTSRVPVLTGDAPATDVIVPVQMVGRSSGGG